MTHTTDQLKDLLAKVTPGEWSVGKQVIGIRNEHGFQHHIVHTLWDTTRGKADATLIAMAPTLAAEVVRLREVLEDIAHQKKSTEFATTQGYMDADFEGGYDECVSRARQALDATIAR